MYRVFAIAVLYVLGLWWCYEVICRLPDEIQEIRQVKQVSRTVAIVFIWALTVIIAAVLVRYGFAVIKATVSSFRDLL